MKNQRGFVTTEFLFAIIIAFGMTMLTFAMTYTLSTVEVVQYIVYSSSRAQAAANFDMDAQKKEAQLRYGKLANNPVLAPLFKNGWFEISTAAQIEVRSGEGDTFERDYPAGGGSTRTSPTYQGVRTKFIARILEMRIPLLGKVTPEDDDGFVTKISALLIREPSQKECLDYMKRRKDELFNSGSFDGRFTRFNQSSDIPIPWEDNAC